MADLTPVTREEMYLDEIADALENGGGGGGVAVYNATITIQKNGTKVDDFTANQRTDKTINITVPTSAADVSALPNTTKYAAALSLTINSSTFVMTGQLKDQNGDNLGTAQTIDLPLESVVVGGSYNSQTKKVVLTLQNGNTIEFSVADLVSGLQTELSASNKLNPAYINYDSTHRAVSDTEKSTWNGKQSALTTEQLAAVNSGITSADVAQITTNKNNISSVQTQANWNTNNGVKNLLPINNATDTTYIKIPIVLSTGTFTLSIDNLTSAATGEGSRCCFMNGNDNVVSNVEYLQHTSNISAVFTITAACDALWIFAGGAYNSSNGKSLSITNAMLAPKALYDADSTYEPYAMSNAELTAAIQALQAQLANQ